jgi:hypothetical protein
LQNCYLSTKLHGVVSHNTLIFKVSIGRLEFCKAVSTLCLIGTFDCSAGSQSILCYSAKFATWLVLQCATQCW